MTEPATEKLIRERLERSGELGKMRAMVVDAALRSISQDSTMMAKLFAPTSTLKAAREESGGKQALAIVIDYLEYLGLNYTLNVLKQEASLTENALEQKDVVLRALNLPDTNSPILTTLIQVVGTEDSDAKRRVKGTVVDSTDSLLPSSKITVVPKKVEGGEDTTYFISKWTGQTFYRCRGQVSGQQVQLEYLTDCTTYILDPLDSITVDDCEGGELIVAACEGSVFLRNCKNMTVYVGCKQLRARDCEHIVLHLFASTDPVIESSHHMTFKPFNLRLPELKSCFKSAHLDPKLNRFMHVYDFTEDDTKLKRPHFTVLYPNHGLHMVDRCKEKGKPECPPEIEDLLEGRIAPASSSESGRNKSYDIKTGAQKWTEASLDLSDAEQQEEEVASDEVRKPAASSQLPVQGRVPLAVQATKPTVPIQAAPVAEAVRGVLDESYSSFDDDDDDDDNADDDALDVDEDSDDF
ncbi:Protein XRP2 [Trypanosoma rangeli]|uniref:Protein XRP2 n=1 Tax=Trypanosoma rangeli TaxID=5698 RepID=A0A3R7NEX5_TRYRA|nr:Protein XRP2 [Trypanosoma rangeli]RNF05487.1 Protein XRP2 [Trypanosoma rangeli]|eukprot:RNF05487.1 Protein XRP2 [Trypanosoma rangeli]